MTELAAAAFAASAWGARRCTEWRCALDTAAKALAAGDIAAAMTPALPSSAFTGLFPDA